MTYVREYGATGPWIFVLHGGPGAPGSMEPIAHGLAPPFHVLEPFQRRSDDGPLSVVRHVEDLRELIRSRCGEQRPALVGSSWGAMLALAFAATYPAESGPIVLVGCGTFDTAARERLENTVAERMTDTIRADLQAIDADARTLDDHFALTGSCLVPIYSYRILSGRHLELGRCDWLGYQQSWGDMLRCQEDGTYPAAFADITTPVLMLHGEDDPHPGTMIRDGLRPHIPHLEYHEWRECGHYPWLEAAVHLEFCATLREWLARHSA